MSKADEIYKELILDIYENGVWDKGESVRTKYEDGMPAYTKSIFGRQVTFEEGEIPILTSKFTGWKTALKEMMLFWIHQTVKKEDFEAWNVKVWDEWFVDGDLGKSYAYQFESRPKPEIVKIPKRTVEKKSELPKIKVGNLVNPNSQCKDSICGEKYRNEYGEFVILDVFPTGTHYEKSQSIKVQFLETGYITTRQKSNLHKLRVKDPYHRTVGGMGYNGNCESVKGYTVEQVKKLREKWAKMINRCYDSSYDHYDNYGGKGVFISEEFLSFENFLIEVKKIPQFFLAKADNFEGWSIDKDYYSSNCYSKDTCVWLTRKENMLYRDNINPIEVQFFNGNSKLYLSIPDVARELNVGVSTAHRWINDENNSYLNYGIVDINYIYNNENDYVYRYKLSRNQVVDIINSIKSNPMSRRLMTSFWNDADVSEKALQECAMQTTWNVRNGKLDLLLYSRSVDSALGLPFNWIQYWFLQQMIAQATGLQAGTFTHQMGNIHYYDRHEEDILKQLDNPTYEQPEFWINPDVNDFFQFTPDDLTLINYENSGKYRYEVAI